MPIEPYSWMFGMSTRIQGVRQRVDQSRMDARRADQHWLRRTAIIARAVLGADQVSRATGMTAQQVEAGMGDVDIEVGADSGRPSVDGASLGDLTRHSMGRLRAVSCRAGCRRRPAHRRRLARPLTE